MSFDRVTFAAKRRKSQEDIITALGPVVTRALEKKAEGSQTWWRAIVDAAQPLFDKIVRDDGGDPARAKTEWAHLALDLTHSLIKTKNIHDYSATLIATWVSSNILSYGTIAAANQAGEAFELEWVTMHDSKVRSTHKDADGQRVKPGRSFRVGTSSMKRPGDVTAPIGEWINCRCSVAAVPVHDNQAASVHTDGRQTRGVTMNDMIQRDTPTLIGASLVAAIDAAPDGSLIPWHGVLTVEGQWSGDRRKFQKGSLSHRDLPLPLTFQKTSAPGHDNNVTVASIDWLDKRGDAWHGGGSVLPTPEADEMVGLLAHFKQFGVSIDADMAEMNFVEYDGATGPSDMDDMPGQEFSSARIAGACVVGIPAFQEAFVTLGEDPDHDYGDAMAASISTLELDDTQEMELSTFTLPSGLVASIEGLIDCPTDAICAHPECTDTPTKVVSTDQADLFVLFCATHASEHEGRAFAVEAGRGPGWITNPEDTKRIHDYWTVPGMPGYAKIGWGTAGDFSRCRIEVGEEIGEGSPDKLRFINQICAQWHHDATGFWPGHAPTEQAHIDSLDTGVMEQTFGKEMAPAVALVASADSVYAPAEWFTDPKFTKKTHFTVTDEGEVIGHVADWETCHMGFNQPGVSMRIEPSTNNYAYFRQGEVLTTDGPVATGPLTLATGHAGGRLRMRPAIAHYDNTGTAVADVVCGDDEFGIWVHGWVRPWISEEKKYELRAHPPSIDQRRNPNTGDYDLIAILSVNAPGLPVLSAGIENGVQMSLIASLGVEVETETEDPIEALAQTIVERLEARQVEREEFEALELEEV